MFFSSLPGSCSELLFVYEDSKVDAERDEMRNPRYKPFRMLHDPPILRPSEPARPLFGIIGSIEDADGIGSIGAPCLWDTPDTQVTIRSLSS